MRRYQCSRCGSVFTAYDHPARAYCFRQYGGELFCGGRLELVSLEAVEAC